jgi:hypothetical protein
MTVDGHFKTFTAEAPLFGKHVGTYWWGGYPEVDRFQLSFDDLEKGSREGGSK